MNNFSGIPALINKTFPIPARFRGKLPAQIAELSRFLTGSRGERSKAYLSRPDLLSAYLYYFFPWNLYRLRKLLPSLEFNLSAGDIITDLGSGPLTFVSALWIARTDLRAVPLEFYCVDNCAPALEAGKKFFYALCENTGSLSGSKPLWKIHTVREDLKQYMSGKSKKKILTEKKAALLCAINFFNELYEKIPHSNTEKLKQFAADIASFMHLQAAEKGQILAVEPGVPQSGRFISFLRSALMDLGRQIASPCAHNGGCPLAENRKKWCNFSFDTDQAPKELHRLSASAGFPKDRAALSYLLTGSAPAAGSQGASARVISDVFSLPRNMYGRYCCGLNQYILLKGDKNQMEKLTSGSIITGIVLTKDYDEKSGAVIAKVLK